MDAQQIEKQYACRAYAETINTSDGPLKARRANHA
jgi:hypothetical protein